jgi:hypothetical protein
MEIVIVILIILGMLAALWSGFYMGFYKREGKAPEVPLPKLPIPELEKKPGKPDKEDEKANEFFN